MFTNAQNSCDVLYSLSFDLLLINSSEYFLSFVSHNIKEILKINTNDEITKIDIFISLRCLRISCLFSGRVKNTESIFFNLTQFHPDLITYFTL